jgi:hypothetical protein
MTETGVECFEVALLACAGSLLWTLSGLTKAARGSELRCDVLAEWLELWVIPEMSDYFLS